MIIFDLCDDVGSALSLLHIFLPPLLSSAMVYFDLAMTWAHIDDVSTDV
jgi:hypothetical protein